MRFFLIIWFLPVVLYPQDSTSNQAMQRRTQQVLNELIKVKHSVDSLKAWSDYLEQVVFGITTLRWSGGDPDGDAVTYDVYFGVDSISPPLVSEAQVDTFYQPGRLNWETTYYWYIVAKDVYGAVTSGPLWHFTTMPVPTQ